MVEDLVEEIMEVSGEVGEEECKEVVEVDEEEGDGRDLILNEDTTREDTEEVMTVMRRTAGTIMAEDRCVDRTVTVTTIPEVAGPMIIIPMVTVIRCTPGDSRQHPNLEVEDMVEDLELDQVHPRCIPRIQRRHLLLSPTDTPDMGKWRKFEIALILVTF